MKKRIGDAWRPAPEYARELAGLTINLLVRDVATSVAFQRAVFGSTVVYADQDFAVLRCAGAEWMIHADHTYDQHVAFDLLGQSPRGIGAEFRLHGTDPDAAEAAARTNGYTVLSAATSKPHGLRETYILDPDGYWWVADIPA